MLKVPQEIRDSLESMHLPSIPEILLRFLHLAEDDSTSMDQLAALVGQDPSLSARMLTVANSAALQRGTPKTTLTQCMVTLGTRLARTLAACLVVQKFFSPATDNRRYDYSGFWGHSLRVAEMSRAIAEELNYPDAEEAYLTGLLHDVGQLLLLGAVGDRYGTLLASSWDEYALQSLEEQQLGTDHGAIGAWMVDQWELPASFMADAILFHHATPEEIVTADTLSQIVWSAHLCCRHHRAFNSEPPLVPPDFGVVETLTGLTVQRAAELYFSSAKQVRLLADAMGVIGADEDATIPQADTAPDAVLPQRDAAAGLSPLEEKVRDMALMEPLLKDLASVGSEAELLFAIRESARILFGLRQMEYLLVQSDRKVLTGASYDLQPSLLQRFDIPLDSRHSLAALATLEKQPCCTNFDEERPTLVSLVDIQITRSLGAEGVLYVPLAGRGEPLGVLVCGVHEAQCRHLQKRLKWMANFARSAAISIENWRGMQHQASQREADLTQRFEQHARKIVHEAGNPLGIIRNYLSIMSMKLPDEAKVLQELDIVREEIERVTQILRRMTSLSEAVPVNGALNLNELIETMLVLYGESLFTSREIIVQRELDRDLANIVCDRDRVKQILFNLFNNASDALQRGNTLTIATQDGVNQNGRSYVELRISDNGPGLPEEVLQRLFTPLEPNRRPGHSGLGLSIVSGVVESLDGRITCISKAGQGTSFSILLPKSRRPDQCKA